MTQESSQTSFIDLPFLYITGLNITWASQTTIQVGMGRARDVNNSFDITLTSNTIVDITKQGINGLDKGSVSANTWYAIYLIYTSDLSLPASCLISANLTSPFLPYRYNYFRRIGWVRTNDSSIIQSFRQSNSAYTCTSTRYYQWETQYPVLSAGTSTSFSSVNLIAAVPPAIFVDDTIGNRYYQQPSQINLSLLFKSDTSNATGSIRPTGSTVTAPNCPLDFVTNIDSGSPSGYPNFPCIQFTPGLDLLTETIPSFDYAISSGTLDIWVVGFYDNL